MSSGNMSQATEVFVTNGRSLIKKILNRIGPRTDPCGNPNFTEEYEPWRKTRCVLPSRYDFKKTVENFNFAGSIQACTS